MNAALINHISKTLGLSLGAAQLVYGGDINACFKLQTTHGSLFVKTNTQPKAVAMFNAEAHGLTSHCTAFSEHIPAVIGTGQVGQTAWLAMEWLQPGPATPGALERLGIALAGMHRQVQPGFGYSMDNFIGSLPQQNVLCESWSAFYASYRILPLVKQLTDAGAFTRNDGAMAHRVCQRLTQWVPKEPPALLHGDLWAGNYMITAAGRPALYDPAVYWGHREMDIAMTRLFGGFGPSFYEAYQAAYPLQPGWQQRIPLMQWYPVLVHAVLFGGHYVRQAATMVAAFA
ncbi:MAG TPA: fructosamine kinase family protein [Phnomibacter sp.]|nr:fructosamine kinase family protein [Phnomibacter sp.]